jgi:hypothetical protein
VGKFCRRPKFAQKEVGWKGIFVFLPASPEKGEVPQDAGRVGGEKIRLLCPTEVFTSLIEGRGGRDRAKNESFLNFV